MRRESTSRAAQELRQGLEDDAPVSAHSLGRLMLLPLLMALLLGMYAWREGRARDAAPPGATSSTRAHEAPAK
jgi:hypothetical protein